MLGDRRLAAGDDVVDVEPEGGGALGSGAGAAAGAAARDQHAHADTQHIRLAEIVDGDDPAPVDAVSAGDGDAGLAGADEVITPAGDGEALAGADRKGRSEIIGAGDRLRARAGDVGDVAQRVAGPHDIGRIGDRARVGRNRAGLPGRRRCGDGAHVFVDPVRFVALGRIILRCVAARRLILRIIGLGARILRDAAVGEQCDDQRGAGPQECASHRLPLAQRYAASSIASESRCVRSRCNGVTAT